MPILKVETIGIYIFAIWIISMTILVDARYVKNGSKYPSTEKAKFDDLNVEAVVYSEIQRTLILKITWNPAITHNDSSFRVVVSPIGGGLCHHDFCDQSGLTTYNATLFVPTKPTNPETSHPQCRIDPGCNYTITIEDGELESKVNYTVPDRVGSVYSCQHELDLPAVNSSAVIDSEWMTIRWQINGNYSIPSDISVYIVVIVTDINDIGTKLKVFNHTLSDPKQQSGEFEWMVPSSSANYLTRTFVFDSHNCNGFPPYLAKAYRKPPIKYPIKWFVVAAATFVLLTLIAWLIYKTKVKDKQHPSKGKPGFFCGIVGLNEGYVPSDIPSEIDHADLTLIKKIGEGAFGTVYIARRRIIFGKPGFQIVAVKQLKKRPTDEQRDEFFGEIEMMKKVPRHSNVVALLGFCKEKEPLQIVMEYVGCGDLRAYLQKLRARHEERYGKNRVTVNPCEHNQPLLAPPSGRYLDLMNSSASSTSDSSHATDEGPNVRPSVTETMYTTLSNNDDITSISNSLEYVLDHKELYNFAKQIAEGMKHLHDMKITHRDLAARNILIDEHRTLKISDFGLSRSGIYVNPKNKAVPLRWLSIEAIRDNFYSSKSDVWAFGVVLWEIGALGGYPYPAVHNYDLLPYLSAGNRLEKPENCSDYLYELMMDCWAANTDDRPDFNNILARLDLHERTYYVDFSELSSDYVFPPTKEQIQNHKMSNGLRH
ncbi:vascular endothelial growth factor receptor 1 isoform X2 [Bradysia coprophila]|uniref:vascular endothelial growth factor receptor 1 isoform X2 n=1 Tax=Bradysia coprophila TaxID=38358 RepID=UPI00187D776A|nr:vascular endothelial growth factor receptor 1 isoform X2 [Bradysia coprophila]